MKNERRNQMKEMTIQDIKTCSFDILKEVADFCEKNNLRYFLCGGTLLGAVRHKGFIPWDDDIDIIMPREDYEKFIGTFASVGYRVLSWEKCKGYYLPFAKVIDEKTCIQEKLVKSLPQCGVFVDIFPLDGLSDDFSIAKKIVKYCNRKMRINAAVISRASDNRVKTLICKACKVLFRSYDICRKIEKKSTKYKFDNSKYAGVACGFYGEREIMQNNIFFMSVPIEFEGGLFSAPADSDTYLKNLYGDYMKLPPVEKRVTHHSFIAYWKEQDE